MFLLLVEVPGFTDHLNDSQLSLLTDKNFQSDDSIHSSNSEAEEAEQQAVFEVRECVVKTGPKKGKIEKKIVLWIGGRKEGS